MGGEGVRIRTIKPDFFKHDKVSDLKPLARLLFISLWCLADRRGRLEDRPKRIKVECLPYDDCDVDALLWELHNAGFIDRYEIEGLQIIEISSFEKHQRISGKEAESESDYPEKQEGSIREAPSTFSESQERKGREGKGREGKGRGKEGSGASADDCLSIYEAYPKKAERPEALKEIAVALKTIAHVDLLAAVAEYAAAVNSWPDDEKHFAPSCGRWMKRQRWLDDRKTWIKKPKTLKNGVQHNGFAETDYTAGLDSVPSY
ncbi:MAG: hypothetical protein IPN63_07860 [Gammaproteobacteria bacterium]|nr:hypothetical protein [Gammaproteobacteria bacterium]